MEGLSSTGLPRLVSSLTIGSYRGKEEEREKDRAEKGQEKKRDGCVRHVGDG